MGYDLPIITDDQEFERLVMDVAEQIFEKKFVLYGRKGQKQEGIDGYDSRDFEIVIQCKNYKTNNTKSLQASIKDDFQRAYDFFYIKNNLRFKTFVVATTINKDTNIEYSILQMNKGNSIKIECLFWEDIKEYILKNNNLLQRYYPQFIFSKEELKSVYTANELYAKSFTETMFLHKVSNNNKVNLYNLFIVPKYIFLKNDEPKTDLEDKLADFTTHDKKFLLIEGDAGCGKSTLVSWINYNVSQNNDTGRKICGDRPLITIRLRDLDREIIKTGKLIGAILKYMNLNSIDELENKFSKALMIMDGFDELCMIENITDYDELIEDFEEIDLYGYQYIITSRPHYLNKNIQIQYDSIILQHFDKEKREEWIEHYTSPSYCQQSLNKEIQDYIINIKNDTESIICDTPMMLYMLAAKDTSIDLTKNSWKLYHHIFYSELSTTEYNKMFSNVQRTYKHNIHRYQNIIYKITEDIAYKMYCTGNNQFYISSNDIKIIIENLSNVEKKLKNENIKDMVEQCYALCNYWKENNNGAVEFYHNNIRDFFLCEKIYRELNTIYNRHDLSKDKKIEQLIEFFMKFKKSSLEKMVCHFILLRAQNDINKQDSFVYQEKRQRLLPNLFEEMLTNGFLYDNLQEKNHIQAIINILSCTAQIYRHIYEPILSESEYIRWWNNAEKINNSKMIMHCFKTVFNLEFVGEGSYGISSKGDYSDINFSLCELVYIDFNHSNLTRAFLNGTNLTGANFSYANLTKANLYNTNLNRTSLTGANLKETTLPDGSTSMDQEKQVKELKSRNIGIIFGDEQSIIMKFLNKQSK